MDSPDPGFLDSPEPLPPHQQRVLTEKAELDAKRRLLTAFIDGPVFLTLFDSEKQLLLSQRDTMTAYSDILCKRIARFSPAPA